MKRAARHSCPQCGRGELFQSYARLRGSCEHCGLRFRREQGAQTGSMYLSAAITQLFACALIFLVWFGTDWGLGASLAVGLPLVAVFCVLFLPYSQALWTAIEYSTDAANREAWVQPRNGRDA